MTAIACESRIEQVTLYARGALVKRAIHLPEALPDEPIELTAPGVTALCEAGSLRAFADGEREITGLRAELVIPEEAARPGRLVEALRDKRFERERLAAEVAHLTQVRAALAGAALDPRLSRWAKRPRAAERFADALALGGILAARIAQIDERQQQLADALDDNQRALAALELEAAQGTTAEIAGERRPTTTIAVRLGAARGRLRALSVEYVVEAARWWPAYTARFSAAATKVALSIEAFVAQATGEDWTGVALSLSTADLAADARLPELRSLRLGRAQPPPRKGYRPPPAGLDAMFEGYDRARIAPSPAPHGARPPPRKAPPSPDVGALIAGTLDEQVLFSLSGAAPPAPLAAAEMPPPPGGFGPPPMQQNVTRAGPMAAPQPARPAAPMPGAMPLSASAPMAKAEYQTRTRAGTITASMAADLEMARQGGGGPPLAAMAAEAPAESIEPGEAFLDFDALTLADPADRGRRGRLSPADRRPMRARVSAARSAVEAIPSPPETRDPLETRGRFDHRYDAEGRVEVPSNARPHRVSLSSMDTTARPRFITVPREAAEVYREAAIDNPFASPLLTGPVDVFFDGALLTTTTLRFVDRKGTIHLGLGVEDRLRVARNARVEEGTAGLLGGSSTVDHNVTIELASSLGKKVTVDVIDRVPVSDEKDIDIKIVRQEPVAKTYTQAERGPALRRGLCWTIEVPAGEKRKIELGYRVTLPAKNEIIGGNRRE
ncbi:MAG: DUF4139 domain-containing protein [Byssovorax sp.]